MISDEYDTSILTADTNSSKIALYISCGISKLGDIVQCINQSIDGDGCIYDISIWGIPKENITRGISHINVNNVTKEESTEFLNKLMRSRITKEIPLMNQDTLTLTIEVS